MPSSRFCLVPCWMRAAAMLLVLVPAPSRAQDDPPVAALAAFNAAIAGLQSDDVGARAALQSLGDSDSQDPHVLALRDRANLALGFHFLDRHDGPAARHAFNRVRANSRCANRALLGAGWAWLVHTGTGAAVATTPPTPSRGISAIGADEVAQARRRSPFRYADSVAAGARADDLRRALIPWTELVGRDPLDPAVQEGMLALPYALAHLGAQEQARDWYVRAVETLNGAQARLADARRAVDTGEMRERLDSTKAPEDERWPAWLADLPKGRWWRAQYSELPEGFYLEALLGNDALRAALERYRAAPDEPDAPHDPDRDLLAGEFEERARRELASRETSIARYLAEAHFALARLNDPVPRDERR